MTEVRPLATSKQTSVSIGGRCTAVWISSYTDHVFVVVSQTGTLGSVLTCRREEHFDSRPDHPVRTLLGVSDAANITCAKQLAELLWQRGCRKCLVLCLALIQPTLSVVREIIAAVADTLGSGEALDTGSPCNRDLGRIV